MLEKDAFLRQVPKALEIKQRIILESAGWAIDSIYLSFDQLKQTAYKMPLDSAAREEEHAIFVNCWSIIDQCHMLRKLLSELPRRPGNRIETFLKKYEQVTLIRNSMDHLHSQLANLAKSKKQRPPIFGALSFCKIAGDDITERSDGSKILIGCTVVTITAGSLTLENHAWNITNPAGKQIENPIGCIEFEAFDYTMSFSDLIADVDSLVTYFDTEVRQNLDERIRAEAVGKGLDPAPVLAARGGGTIKLAAKMRFLDSSD